MDALIGLRKNRNNNRTQPRTTRRNWQEYFDKDDPLWTKRFGQTVDKDHPIWETYVEVAIVHDNDVIEGMDHAMDILLVFSALFAAVVTTFIVQVEQDLNVLDPASYTAKILNKIFTDQLNVILRFLDPNTETPQPDPFIEESPVRTTVATTLWYVSLDCALLVAGGAACLKQWILEYKRADRLHRVPYDRAIHHQERYAALRKWHISEFGDLLGCIMLLDLVPFFVGSVYHLDGDRTGTELFWDLTWGFVAAYSAFLAFTIIVGIWVPKSPFKTPISNLIQRVPEKVQHNYKNSTAVKLMLVVSFVVSVITITLVWIYTDISGFWFILLWLAPTILFIVFGLRNGLKMGRVSHYVPLMSIAIALLTGASLAFVDLHSYVIDESKNIWIGVPFIYLVPFTLVIMGLSRRFSNPRSQRRFPVNTLLLAAVGLVLGLFIAWHFNIKDVIFTPEEEDVYLSNWALPTAGAIVWASMMLLGGATLLQEDEVEEDIREAEALSWLINQAENSQTLHDALMCLPGIANTPLRRYTLLTNTRDILALLINTLVDDLDQRCLLERFGENRSIESGHDYDVDREARLMFYLACLAEVSPVTLVGETRRNPWRTRWNNLMNKVDGSWLYQNWYRVLTIPPREIMTRELRFPRTWYPWLQFTKPDVFLLDLKTLSNHPNPYISSVARAVLSHLYPSVSPLNDYSSWPVRRDKLPDNPDFFTHHKILIELRMVTLWVTDECRSSKNLETSLRRYLYRYCDNVLKLWTSGLAPQEGLEDNERDGKVFEVAIVLCYLVTENSQSILRMTDGGESTPMKAARCLTSLIRWLERGQAQDQKISAMDVEFRNSFALSIVSATAAYLQFAADTLTPGTQLTRMTRVEDDENTIFVGMKHLEIPLLKLSTREFPIPSLQGQAISALEAFYRIPGHADFKLFSWDLSDDLIPLMTELKSRAMASDAVKKRVHAIQAASKVLNLVKEPLRAWSIAIDGSPSLLEVIGSMAQDESVDIRIAALSVLLETPVLHPRKFAQREIDAATTEKASPISSDAGQIHIDVHLTPDEKLSTLYNSVLRDHSALLQAAQGSFSLYNKELIRKSLHFINMLESTVPHGSLPSTLLENGKYAGVLALIASHSDEELVDVPTRKLAISLYIRLWNSTCGANQPKPATQFEDVFGGELHLGEITKAVQWLTDHYVSVELDCIALYIMQLQHLSSPVADGLLKALKGAVACGDFGNPDVEERRQALYDQLSQFLLTTPP